jgi:hypothetical protein
MRKQLLIPVASDDILQTFWEDGEASGPGNQSAGWRTKEPPTIR